MTAVGTGFLFWVMKMSSLNCDSDGCTICTYIKTIDVYTLNESYLNKAVILKSEIDYASCSLRKGT